MRITGIFALCLASAFSLTAAGQSNPSQPAGQNAQPKNSSAAPGAQNTPKAVTQAAAQPEGFGLNAKSQGTSELPPLAPGEFLRMTNPTLSQKPQTQRKLPQVPFDRGIYVGRNSVAGDNFCLAIQSYNFSQGESPKLESVTTCTTLRQPLMRHARKPANTDQQGQGTQQETDKDKK